MSEEHRNVGLAETQLAAADAGPTRVADGPPREDAHAPEARARGEILAGRYELLGLLGRGGMGSVYRARDLELDELVALKTLHAGGSDEEALARFRREVKLARRVTHPNVARTFDIGEHKGTRFLTMEHVDGESIDARISRKGAHAPADAIRIARDVASALEAAHAADVVHRDLKPENVLVERTGRVVVTDFGIAYALGASTDPRRTQGIIGTPAYMAPEQVEGTAIDARADVYALGELLYELLTGKQAWTGTTPFAVAAARLVHPPPDPRDAVPGLDPDLAATVVRAMARNREVRFPTAAALRDALDAFAGSGSARGTLAPVREDTRSDASPGRPSIAPSGARFPTTATGLRGPARSGVATRSIVVMPFGSPPADASLAVALSQELIDALSVDPRVAVAPLGAVLDATAEPLALAREMRAAALVVGRVARSGDGRLSASARSVSTEDGFQIGVAHAARPEGELRSLGADLGKEIASSLTIRLDPPPPRAPLPPEIASLFWEAKGILLTRVPGSAAYALDLVGRALVHAPDDPDLLALYALAQIDRFNFNPDFDASLELARDAIARALVLGPSLPEPLFASASLALSIGDPARAFREAKAALALPGGARIPEIHELLGGIQIACGRFDEGVAAMRRTIALEPRAHTVRVTLAYMFELRGDRDAADALLEAPPHPNVVFWYWIIRARITGYRYDVAGARALLERTDVPIPPREILKIVASGGGGDEVFRHLRRLVSPGACAARIARFSTILAEVHLLTGDAATSLDALAAIDGASGYDVHWLDNCPLLDPIRREPRFVEIAARIRARASAVAAA